MGLILDSDRRLKKEFGSELTKETLLIDLKNLRDQLLVLARANPKFTNIDELTSQVPNYQDYDPKIKVIAEELVLRKLTKKGRLKKIGESIVGVLRSKVTKEKEKSREINSYPVNLWIDREEVQSEVRNNFFIKERAFDEDSLQIIQNLLSTIKNDQIFVQYFNSSKEGSTERLKAISNKFFDHYADNQKIANNQLPIMNVITTILRQKYKQGI